MENPPPKKMNTIGNRTTYKEQEKIKGKRGAKVAEREGKGRQGRAKGSFLLTNHHPYLGVIEYHIDEQKEKKDNEV